MFGGALWECAQTWLSVLNFEGPGVLTEDSLVWGLLPPAGEGGLRKASVYHAPSCSTPGVMSMGHPEYMPNPSKALGSDYLFDFGYLSAGAELLVRDVAGSA